MPAVPEYEALERIDREIPVIRLHDNRHGIEVGIVPSAGNRAYEMLVHGKNILYCPFEDIRALKEAQHLNGIPFLAPWANRIPEAFRVNGKKYVFNPGLGSLRLDQNGTAIHGMLTSSPFWEVVSAGADDTAAQVTSRLAFWRYPDLLANWPFAHEYEMTYRLSGGVLEVALQILNLSVDPMPVAVGFHPYFQLPETPLDSAYAHIAARRHVDTDERLLATGALSATGYPERVSLKDHRFDDGFTELIRGANGRAEFYVEGDGKRITAGFGRLYPVAIVYAPAGHDFICFEPMSAITNGINLAAEGKYADLQTLGPGKTWQESFWIGADGF